MIVFPYRPAFRSLACEVYDSLLNRCVELGWIDMSQANQDISGVNCAG